MDRFYPDDGLIIVMASVKNCIIGRASIRVSISAKGADVFVKLTGSLQEHLKSPYQDSNLSVRLQSQLKNDVVALDSPP